jgi:hypothetical protein
MNGRKQGKPFLTNANCISLLGLCRSLTYVALQQELVKVLPKF